MLRASLFLKNATRVASASISRRGLQGLVVGVPKEITPEEDRVAITPANVIKLKKAGATVKIESGAGANSGFTDAMYQNAGAVVVGGEEVWKSQFVAKVLLSYKYACIFGYIMYLLLGTCSD